MSQVELFPVDRPTPEQIVAQAIEQYNPVAIYVLFSGGRGSQAAKEWSMANVPGCRVAHIATGIGIPATTEHVIDDCRGSGQPLTVIRSKEDCGQDYDQIVLKHGFPGPSQHNAMYSQLKERAIRYLVRKAKADLPERERRQAKVMLLTGITHDDSVRRSGYGNDVIKPNGGQLWVNHLYWEGSTKLHHSLSGVRCNPVSDVLGMSGECLCGAFAQPGELDVVRLVCPKTARRIEDLEVRVRRAGHDWGWEQMPPRRRDDQLTQDMFMPMCRGCLKEQERKAA